jgi:tetratricopeptide (TPR) repeat protein
MSDPLFERYKEALKAGHVAVLRGRLDDALDHYRTASAIAEERPLPHASMGGVLLRLGRAEEALACYDRALQRAPDYEVAVAGRAEALVVAGRNAEAADALERLAEIRLIAGRPEEARDALRRALALHDTDGRRRHAERVERLVEERGVPPGAVRGDEGGGEPVGSAPAAADQAPSWPAEREEAAAPGHPDDGRATDVLRLMIPGASAAGAGESEAGEEVAGATGPADASGPAGAAAMAEEVVPVTAAGAEALLAEAERRAATGETEAAVDALVRAADAFLGVDATDAATDACQRALELAPGSPDVHLALVRLYLATGSRDLAAEKLLLLGRLLDLGGTAADRERVASVARETFPGDTRFDTLA